MMSSATANTARMIAKLLAERPTAHQDIPQLIDVVHRTLAGLNGARPVDAPMPQNGQDAPDPDQTGAASAAPKRRGRRSRAEAEPAAETPVETKTEPAQVAQLTPPRRDRLTRGVVRWFDPQTRRGAL